jgi:hypothetical protein
MIETAPIFLGVVPRGARSYVARELVRLGLPLYNACAGRFTIIETAIKDGLPAAKVFASDIGLFSSIIGYLADPEKTLEQLNIKILDPVLEPSGLVDELDYAAHILLILKLNQTSQRNLRGLYLREEIISSWSQYRQSLKDQLTQLLSTIRGIHYELADIWEIVRRVQEQDVSFFASVPHYCLGVDEKLLAAPNLKWSEPSIPEFDPERFSELCATLGESRCAAMLCRRGEWQEAVPAPWRRVYGRPEDREKALWILSNRAMQSYAENQAGYPDVRKLPIYDDHEITPESKFTILMAGMPTVLYYRDLFVHRLGATTADRGFLVLVDGQVMTAFGIFIQDFLQFRAQYLLEMFGITRSSQRYQRLGKLFMLLLTSGEMKKRLCDLMRLWLHEPLGIQTTSITAINPEGKTDRSALKLQSREKLPDNRYRLVYRAEFRQDSFAEVVADWLKKHGKRRKTEGQ